MELFKLYRFNINGYDGIVDRQNKHDLHSLEFEELAQKKQTEIKSVKLWVK